MEIFLSCDNECKQAAHCPDSLPLAIQFENGWISNIGHDENLNRLMLYRDKTGGITWITGHQRLLFGESKVKGS